MSAVGLVCPLKAKTGVLLSVPTTSLPTGFPAETMTLLYFNKVGFFVYDIHTIRKCCEMTLVGLWLCACLYEAIKTVGFFFLLLHMSLHLVFHNFAVMMLPLIGNN